MLLATYFSNHSIVAGQILKSQESTKYSEKQTAV